MAIMKREGKSPEASTIQPFFQDSCILNGAVLNDMKKDAEKPKSKDPGSASEDAVSENVSPMSLNQLSLR